MKITLKNYRCFPDSRPAIFEVRGGFTAFVGTNNSGKSSLLKFFHEFRGLFRILSALDGGFMQALKGQAVGFSISSISDTAEVFCNTNKRDMEIVFELSPAGGTVPAQVVVTIPNPQNSFRVKLNFHGNHTLDMRGMTLKNAVLTGSDGMVADVAPYLKEFQALAEAFYVGPFRNAINVGTKDDYFDIQVGEAFITKWRSLKTGNLKRNNELTIRVTGDIERIFEYDQLQIDASEDLKTLQVFADGKSYKLTELGSGLTQFVLVLGNAAIRQPTYILIDEPELNLHPSLMLEFLTTLATYSSVGVLFSTHSMGLARAAAEKTYSLRRLKPGESQLTEYEATPRLSEFLGELSFSGYREIGVEKILLVEGPTDVKTVQQFLRWYKMDHKVVLLHLGGSSLINGRSEAQLEEIKRICTDISALIDSERSASGAALAADRVDFRATCQKAGIDCHVLDRRAIENYLAESAVKRVKGDAYRGLGTFEPLKAAYPCWSKAENWRIAREMSIEDLAGTDLGTFLGKLCAVTPSVAP